METVSGKRCDGAGNSEFGGDVRETETGEKEQYADRDKSITDVFDDIVHKSE